MIAAPVRLWAMHCRLHLLQGHQTLAQGPTQRQHSRLMGEGGASIQLLWRPGAIGRVKCLHAGVALYIAGGETVLTSGAAFTLTDGQDVQGIHPSCISAVYDAFTGQDVTDTIAQGSSRAQATPMEVFTAEATPDDVPRVTVHTKEELQDALEFLTAAVLEVMLGRTSTPGRRDSVLSLACTLLAAGRRAQGAGGEGKIFAERVDEVCLHLTAGRFDQEAGGGAEGGEGGEGAVAGLSTLLFLLCHGRTNFRRSSRRRSGDFLLSGPFAFSCQVEDNIRLEAERRWTASFKERMDVESCCFICDLAGRSRGPVPQLEVGGSWVLSVLIFSCDRHRSRPANGPRPSWFAVSLQLPMLIDRWIRRSLRRRRRPVVAFSRAFQAFVNLPQE